MGAISNRHEMVYSFSHAPWIGATKPIKDYRLVAVDCGAWEMWGNDRFMPNVLPCTLPVKKIDRAQRGGEGKGNSEKGKRARV
ncbi:MAG: hypothetical protein BJG00_014555 [Limnothrix sp. CACIAM 69d]|nr:MAG: hypothetical protein BJG00_014555 [Limnothrix sp. CACIAM 69d]